MGSLAVTKSKTGQSAVPARLAKPLAPEEIRPGDFVTPLHMIAEVPSYYWMADDWKLAVNEPVRIRFTPTSDGLPLKVQSICLPFVLVGLACGHRLTLDVRKYQLARLDRQFAKSVWKSQKKARK